MLEKMIPTIGLPASNRTENGVKSDDLEGLAGFTQERVYSKRTRPKAHQIESGCNLIRF